MSTDIKGLTAFDWPGTWVASGDNPVVLDSQLRGTLQSIDGGSTEQLTSIKGQRLKEGMLVYVKTGYTAGGVTRAGDSYYKYLLLAGETSDDSGNLPNNEANWSLLSFSGGSGNEGATGASGLIGPSGATGLVGPSGATGVEGATGLVGPSGATGVEGPTGATGVEGATGLIGPTGATGVEGPTGATGLVGPSGATGPEGATGATGLEGPKGATGVSDRYLTSSTTPLVVSDGAKTLTVEGGLSYSPTQYVKIVYKDDISKYMEGSVVSYTNNITSGQLVVNVTVHSTVGEGYSNWSVNLAGGVAGPRGDAGATGPSGLIGLTGPSGATGAEGPTGATGIEGATGPSGATGAIGATGVNGGDSLFNSGATGFVYNVSVGGATGAQVSEWETKTVNQVLDAILFPTLQPEYIVPTITLTGPDVGPDLGCVEVAGPITKQFSVSAIKNDAGDFTSLELTRNNTTITNSFNTSNATDMPDSFGISGNNNNPNKEYTLSYNDTGSAPVGTITWEAKAAYGNGGFKQTNKGDTDTRTRAVRTTSAAQAFSSDFKSAQFTAKGVYPVFYGTSASPINASGVVAALDSASKIIVDPEQTITVNFNASVTGDGKYLWLAVHKNYTQKTVWYNTPVNNGSIGDGQLFNSPATQTVASVTGSNWTNQDYKIYISSIATVTEGTFEFRN